MAGSVPNHIRDFLAAEFRKRICEVKGVIPFEHQARWWAAADGYELLDIPDKAEGWEVQLPDKTRTTRMVVPREGGPARVIADMGSFKIGKSFGAAMWLSGFAAVPNARISLVGLEYDICEPEFTYIIENLLSESGMNLPYKSYQNRPRDGRMFLDLENGARYEAKSWERKDTLKGKEVDVYCYCEAYMLPGLECFTDVSQNLRARDGYALFPTTPDRPWVQILHDNAHSGDEKFSNWHCTCGIPADVNPHTFDPKAKERDRDLMTREKFAIHYEGKLGDYVGRVYNFTRGERLLTPETHPQVWKPNTKGTSPTDLDIPDNYAIIGGVDTGTFYTAALVAFTPDGDALVIDEFPNYSYVANTPERDEGITIPEWSHYVTESASDYGMRPIAMWADKNSQFKKELRNYGLHLLASPLPLETRTEISREYFQHGKVFLAPWLKILPYELEKAQWPEEASKTGKFSRLKLNDHTLDCLEHILSRRPRGRLGKRNETGTWIEEHLGRAPRRKRYTDPHTG